MRIYFYLWNKSQENTMCIILITVFMYRFIGRKNYACVTNLEQISVSHIYHTKQVQSVSVSGKDIRNMSIPKQGTHTDHFYHVSSKQSSKAGTLKRHTHSQLTSEALIFPLFRQAASGQVMHITQPSFIMIFKYIFTHCNVKDSSLE